MSKPAPALSRVLCATDLTDFGNRAVPYAFALAAPKGHVTLLHVLRTASLPSPLVPHYGEKRASAEQLAAEEQAAAARLAALGAEAGVVGCEVRVVRAAQVSEAILAEAARLGVDAICLATHSRANLAQLMLGSAAHDVVHHAARPVLLIPSPLAR
jgi:nucleotide-binding universal stress UspA family protein